MLIYCYYKKKLLSYTEVLKMLALSFEKAFSALPNYFYNWKEPVWKSIGIGLLYLENLNVSILGHCLSCFHKLSEEYIE